MKRALLIVATLVVGMLLGAVAMGTAFAADPTPGTAPSVTTPGTGFGRGGMMGGTRGGMRGNMMNNEMGLEEDVLALLGMTREQVIAERQAGKSLVQIAQAKGKTEQQLVSAILAAKRADLDKLVAAKTLTQAQADLMYQNMQQTVPQAVNRTTAGPMRGGNGNVAPGDCPMLDGDETPANGQQFGRGGMGGRGGMMRGSRTSGPSA